ncbi:MAG: hypothetical protein H6502_01090 [Candidatus Woesearchaeota archaeon]|nr:MAG: hypothetical protein H6502_01090 [Candidatus Woesearchaeota archaeon]
MINAVLLRYDELGIKSRGARMIFERKYVFALRDALRRKGVKGRIKNFGGRFIIYSSSPDEVLQACKFVPAVASLSPAFSFSFASLDELLMQATRFGLPLVANKKFRVRVKSRTGKHEFSSDDVAKELGAKLYKASAGVDLHTPEVTIFVEVRQSECFVYASQERGLGGLPPGSGEKLLLLYSGGIDSPVAAIELLKRGFLIDFLFVQTAGDAQREEVARGYNYLVDTFCFNYKPKLFIVDASVVAEEITSAVPSRFRQIAFKRFLYELSAILITQHAYVALATGEVLSQKSSQTGASLAFIQKKFPVPVFRPLLTQNKQDIIALARWAGTFTYSEHVQEHCSLSEGPVATSPKEKDEEHIPSFRARAKKLILESLTFAGLYEETLSFTSLADLAIIDLRTDAKVLKFGASFEVRSFPEILDELDDFDKKKSYLIICKGGYKSFTVERALQKRGISAKAVSEVEFDRLKK